MFWDLLVRIPGRLPWKAKGLKKSYLDFQTTTSSTHKQSSYVQKVNKPGTGPAQVNRELLS